MYTAAPHILMCPPDFYGIEYEINAWMNQERNADHELATRQWLDLKSHIEKAGARVSTLEPVRGLPDLVFTANAAIIYRRRAILSRFRHEQRQGEESHFALWLTANGFTVSTLPDEAYFEGAGDALFCGDTLLAGYRMRSEAASMQHVGQQLGVRVIPMELVDPYFYHLDTCFCPFAPGSAFWFPDAFDDYGKTALTQAVPDLIEVNETEARRFACNAVVIGKTILMNTGCDQLAAELTGRGYQVVSTSLSEFVKAGGSAKCLTLRLDGEQAAGWRASEE